ncbi:MULTISPECIES: DUF6878 family protein [Sphingomonadales]|jgi:hypothetical protein|uniref:DUF6878 family protein n=1 Tax=Sphingomonadales TaxID=204457 RepID=UPI000B3C7B28|nr:MULTISPECIES: DUF6878 family protein [Sphingomonadales]MBA4757616.1 hypothetical protein [Sphingosinicella sp.]
MTDTTQPTIDMDALMSKYALWEAAAAALVPDNKARLFAFLASARITRVTVLFDGEGDSSQIEDITAYQGDAQVALPDGKVLSLDLPYGQTQPVERQHSAELALETMAFDLLKEKHDGWENSDGAYGEFTFDVAAGTITLDYNERFMSSEHHAYSW